MQTFLPYPNFTDSVQTLDRQRLGKQRVETLQIMSALLTGSGWVNHPATKMWRGYEAGLLEYQRETVIEWLERGYKDTCWEKTYDLFLSNLPRRSGFEPPWLGDRDFHISHQSNLLRKDPQHYGPYFPGVPDDLPYIWPN